MDAGQGLGVANSLAGANSVILKGVYTDGDVGVLSVGGFSDAHIRCDVVFDEFVCVCGDE